ncbi:MAG: rhamnulokinase [Phycisphaeraceae bacterium]|nr:rhamnulokinase [Phycisphaeraceae bacterium]
MADSLNLAAVDLGASGGRVLLAQLHGGKLELRQMHRFEHRPIYLPDDTAPGLWCWDVLGMWEQIKRGLALAGQQVPRLDGIGIDTWGVDYGLLDKSGRLVRPPVAYRDPRTDKTCPRVLEKLGRDAIYRRTGIQFMALNTLYQLAADAEDPLQPLQRTDKLLMMPQLLAYWLTGEKVGELTMASTSQIYDAVEGRWVSEFAEALGVPLSIFPDVIAPEKIIGTLRSAVAEELGLSPKVPVIATGSHDTASAVAATPLGDKESAYLSSGTWSLLGFELDAPLRSDAALEANFTNESGVAGTTRLLKNVTGLWLVQECRRVWAEAGQKYSYEQLAQWAEQAGPSPGRIDPNDSVFASPGDMPGRIAERCRQAGIELPDSPGKMVRLVLDSLANSYARVLATLSRIANRPIHRLHIVGGGGHNQLLNQLTADATKLPVQVGPYEATATGNALVQAIALGALRDVSEARSVVAASFDLKSVEPR